MYWWIAAIVVVLVVGQLVAMGVQRRDHSFEKSAVALQALATAIALMFAGYWYIYERKGLPQADTALKVVGVKVDRDLLMLEVRFAVHNLGATLLLVGNSDVRLQQMNPNSLPLDALRKLDWEDWPARVAERDAYYNGGLNWPTIRRFSGGETRQIEPGETDLKIVDMLADCRSKAVRVFFAMQRPGTDQVWSDQAILSLSSLCARPIGSKEMLSETKSD